MDLALKYQNSANMKFLENNFRYSIEEPIWICHCMPASRQVYPTKIWQIFMPKYTYATSVQKGLKIWFTSLTINVLRSGLI